MFVNKHHSDFHIDLISIFYTSVAYGPSPSLYCVGILLPVLSLSWSI